MDCHWLILGHTALTKIKIMYPDRDTFEQLYPARDTLQHMIKAW